MGLGKFRLLLILGLTVLLAGLAVLLCTAWQIVSYSYISSTAHADAAIVLGAAAWGNRPSPVYRERIEEAIALYKTRRVRYIVFTGGTPESDYPTEGDVGRSFAISQGLPVNVVLAESVSRSTWQNLAMAQNILAPLQIRTVLLVSDPLHMRRAMSMAQDLGLNAAPAPTPSSRIHSLASRSKFLWRETWLYLAFVLWGEPS